MTIPIGTAGGRFDTSTTNDIAAGSRSYRQMTNSPMFGLIAKIKTQGSFPPWVLFYLS